MSVGKSSISRMAKTSSQPAEGIRTLAPEVPAGDAATPPKKTTTTVKKSTASSSTKKTATKSAVAAKPAKADGFSTVAIGGELPYWLL